MTSPLQATASLRHIWKHFWTENKERRFEGLSRPLGSLVGLGFFAVNHFQIKVKYSQRDDDRNIIRNMKLMDRLGLLYKILFG
jgi:hypothetical protein